MKTTEEKLHELIQEAVGFVLSLEAIAARYGGEVFDEIGEIIADKVFRGVFIDCELGREFFDEYVQVALNDVLVSGPTPLEKNLLEEDPAGLFDVDSPDAFLSHMLYKMINKHVAAMKKEEEKCLLN